MWFKGQWPGPKATVQTTVCHSPSNELQVYFLDVEKSSKAPSGTPGPWQSQELLPRAKGSQDSGRSRIILQMTLSSMQKTKGILVLCLYTSNNELEIL